jgi:hypothetical protein
VVYAIGKIGLEKGAEPNGMPSSNDMILLDGRGVQKLTKFVHSLQTIRVQWLVTSMETHIDLIGVDILEIAGF